MQQKENRKAKTWVLRNDPPAGLQALGHRGVPAGPMTPNPERRQPWGRLQGPASHCSAAAAGSSPGSLSFFRSSSLRGLPQARPRPPRLPGKPGNHTHLFTSSHGTGWQGTAAGGHPACRRSQGLRGWLRAAPDTSAALGSACGQRAEATLCFRGICDGPRADGVTVRRICQNLPLRNFKSIFSPDPNST